MHPWSNEMGGVDRRANGSSGAVNEADIACMCWLRNVLDPSRKQENNAAHAFLECRILTRLKPRNRPKTI